MTKDRDIEGLAALANLVERFREVQDRFDSAERGTGERLVHAREERALRAAIGDATVVLLPALLEVLVGTSRQIEELRRENDHFEAAREKHDARLIDLERGLIEVRDGD
jgi:hypothetical protein